MYPFISRKATVSLFIFSLTLGSCTSLKRYSSVEPPGTDNNLADIDLFSSRLLSAGQVSTGKSLWDLSADAQSQFIKILNTRFPGNDMFLNSLNNLYMIGGDEVISRDYVRKDLRLVFSVSRKRDYLINPLKEVQISPADRLEYLKVSLILKDTCIKFTGWNRYSTEYGSIDIGDVSFGRSLDLSSSFSLPGSNDKYESSSEGKESLTRDEKQSVKYRYIRLTGRLSDRVIEMEEEGTRETDLAGNIIADVSLEFEGAEEIVSIIRGLKDSTGSYNYPGRLSLESYTVMVPDIRKTREMIEADLNMYFIYRNVKKGTGTYPEWDDRVKYYEGRVSKPVSLFRESDYVPGFCFLGRVIEGNMEPVTVRKQSGDSSPLIFRTYAEAAGFREWLVWFSGNSRYWPVKISGCAVQFNGKDLTPDLILSDPGIMVIPYYR